MGFRWTETDSADDRWKEMDTGPFFSGTIAHPGGPTHKGLVVRVGDQGQGAVCYDTELLRVSAAWSGGFLAFNPARFGLISPPAAAGTPRWSTPPLPGWSHDGTFDDPREHRPYGPLPRERAHYRGLYRHGRRVVLEYTVGHVVVRESPWLERHGDREVFTRTLEVGLSREPLQVLVGDSNVHATLVGDAHGAAFGPQAGCLALHIPAAGKSRRFKILLDGPATTDDQLRTFATTSRAADDLVQWTAAGPSLWGRPLVTRGVRSPDTGPYVLDTLTLPVDNPHRALLFCSGHDFFRNGDAAVCTAHGDVWIVSGIDENLERLAWQRFATGLFQPLGLKIVDDQVYVLGRDQITRLHDRSGDGEADFYENFNNEGHVTANAHEFAACLETDSRGYFYYLKGDSNSQTLHDGCLLRVTPDGSRLDVFATGIRNGNGLAVGPGDTITAAPQEGNWTPASAIFQVKQGGFYGAMQSHHRTAPPGDYEPPLCWIPRLQDNSSGGQTWVAGQQWGPLDGQLLHFSFGTCKMFLVVRENQAVARSFAKSLGTDTAAADRGQSAGTVAFPLDFASGAMRGRFRPQDGQLYVSGLKGWVSRAVQDGCFQRVRYTGQPPVDLPLSVETYRNGLAIAFSRPLDRREAEDPDNYHVQQWNYRWSAEYGSPELRVSQPLQPGRDEVDIASATLSPDGRTVFLEMPDLQPVMQLSVGYTLKTAGSQTLKQTLDLTVSRVGGTLIPAEKLSRSPRPGQLPTALAEALVPGLTFRFRSADNAAPWLDSRRQRMAAMHVPAGESPSPCMAPGSFVLKAEGFLSVPLKGRYRFDLAGSGEATLEINGQTVATFSGSKAEPDVCRSDPAELTVPLHRGYNAVRLQYRSPPSGAATLRAFWAGETFASEPLPSSALVTDRRDEPLRSGQDWRTGLDLVSEHRCVRCHPTLANASIAELDAPVLHDAAQRLQAAWLHRWLLDPHAMRRDARMPRLFDAAQPADRQAAADIVAYLVGDAKPVDAPAPDDALHEQGQVLWETLGCIACHRYTPPSDHDLFDRVTLHYVREKYRPEALRSFLREPHKSYSRSRMPDFRLTDEEARSLAAVVCVQSTGTLDAAPTGAAARGKQAFVDRGCQFCHARSANEPAVQGDIRLNELSRGCLADDATHRRTSLTPRWAFTDVQRKPIREFLQRPAKSPSTIDASRRAFDRLRCAACHPRDGQPAILPQAIGEDSELGLLPEQFPNLSWTGEKLNGDWLEQFIAGKFSRRPRPWLRGRMPVFPADASILAAGLAREHGVASEPESTVFDRELAQIGARLTERDGGLDCRQCHAIGLRPATGDKATQIALGINFAEIRPRLRPAFYQRFVLDPPRFDSGTRMPILVPDGRTTAVKTLLEGDARRQLDAIWQFIQTVEQR